MGRDVTQEFIVARPLLMVTPRPGGLVVGRLRQQVAEPIGRPLLATAPFVVGA